jgi:hypothetical protein
LFTLLQKGTPIAFFGVTKRTQLKTYVPLWQTLKASNIDVYYLAPALSDYPPELYPTLIDIFGDWRRLYRLDRDFCCVIRPDGHIGLLQPRLNALSLRQYIRRFSKHDYGSILQ